MGLGFPIVYELENPSCRKPPVSLHRFPLSVGVASGKSDSGQFFAVALFSGIGLLISLVAIIVGVPGAWY